ncbi:MAG: lytic transglycosylase domain-containing protein [Terriglobia bacterium]
MHNRTQCCLMVFACLVVWGLSLSRPARAGEIVSITDEQGRKVFINTSDARAKGEMATRAIQPVKADNAPLPPPEINDLVEQTASRHQIDPQLVHAIIKVESEYDPKAVSRKGAMGLMQLIPETAQRFGVANPFNPKENIEGGVSYLKHLLNLFGGDLSLSLAAYNAGEGAVQRFGGIPSFAETRDYVRKVTDIYQSVSPQSGTNAAGNKPQASAIVRYVDERGGVHYSNVE